MGGFHKIAEWGRAHPAALGIGIFVLGLIVLWILWPSKPAPAAQQSDPLAGYYAAAGQAAASGNALQAANIAAQADSNKVAAELQSALDDHATQLKIADLNNKTTYGVSQLNNETDRARIAATAQSTDLASTLTAQVQAAGVEAQRQVGLYAITGATEQAQIASNTAISGQYYNAQTANSAFNAQIAGYMYANDTAHAQYASQTAGYMYGAAASIAGSQAARDASIAQSGAQAIGSYWDAQKVIQPDLIAAQREIAYNQWAQVYKGGAPIDYSGPLGSARTGAAPTVDVGSVIAMLQSGSGAGFDYAKQVLGIA